MTRRCCPGTEGIFLQTSPSRKDIVLEFHYVKGREYYAILCASMSPTGIRFELDQNQAGCHEHYSELEELHRHVLD